jgi:phospholipid transport system substrate-binding protein
MPVLPPRRRAFLRLSAALLLMRPFALASAGPPTESPIAPIQALNQGLIRIMEAGRSAPFQQRAEVLAPAIDQGFDLPEILKFSVGLGWSSLTGEQQAGLLAAFRRYTIASYVENFDNYDGQRFEIGPTPRVLSDGRQVVDTRIVPRSGTPHTLDYVMKRTDTGWKVVDVLADGSISRVAVQRSDFSTLFSKGGAPALEASLQQKTEALSRG